MSGGYFRYEQPYQRPRRKANLFAWTIAILLLLGVAFAAWLGSYYVFSQPERPDSYRLLQKLRKIEAPKRFQLTAAPSGEFLNSKQLHERYSAMRPAELAKANAELARNYIRNFHGMSGPVQYAVGRFTVMESRELTPDDIFTSGMVALAEAADNGEVLLEHVYPADAQAVPLMQQTLVTGLEIKLERAHDLAAVIHAERLRDGRIMFTVVPLLYGSYTVTQGRGTFSLEPPYELNMDGGWPIFKDEARHAVEVRYAQYRERVAPRVAGGGIPLPGLNATPTPASSVNELVRVEQAVAVPGAPPVATPAPTVVAQASPTPKGGKVAKGKGSPSPSPAAVAAAATPAPGAVAVASPVAVTTPPALAVATPTPLATAAPGVALASTAGGGNWKTYPAGKMPQGRLITTGDLGDVADRGLAGDRVYLRGQFVVNFAESNRAVLRPKSGMAESVLRLGTPSSTRIIVEFPAGYKPPEQGSTVTRDEQRPYEITEVRKQSDGQLNVFVREIMQ